MSLNTPHTSKSAEASAGQAQVSPLGLTGIKLQIVEAGLETLKTSGYAGASARHIARTGDFNQALIFYHFNTVQNLLLVVLDEVSARRMEMYGEVFAQAATARELAVLGKEIYADDAERGYITVLGEMVAAGVADKALGAQVAARLQPWIEMVEAKAQQMLAGSPLEALLPPREIAFAFVSLYLGIDMLSHLEGNQTRAESLLELGVQLATMAEALIAPTNLDLPTDQNTEA